MLHLRKLVALVCIGLVLFAAFTPGVAAHGVVIVLDRVWALFEPQSRIFVPHEIVRAAEQTLALVPPLFSRPPPILA